MNRNDQYLLAFICVISVQFGFSTTASFAHSDVFLGSVTGRVAIGGANELGTVEEHFDLDTRVFEGVMIPGFPPFAPADYGRNEPGFFALPSGDSALPAGATSLPANGTVSVNFPSFAIGGLSDDLFYWNGEGPVDFQPASIAQPGLAMTLEPTPIGNAGPSGGLDLHPAFKLDDGGAGVPGDGVYLIAPTVSVAGLADSDRFFMLWLVDALLADEDAAEELEEALEMGHTTVHGKDFAFFEEAVEFVVTNLVPEPSGPLLALTAIVAMAATTRRQLNLFARGMR